MFDTSYIEAVNKTARTRGAVGSNAILPKLVLADTDPDDVILDYGAGPEIIQTRFLRRNNRICFAWDIGKNRTKHHLKYLTPNTYTIVMASNVLNVQPDGIAIYRVLTEIRGVLTIGGFAYFNYPKAPRKSTLNKTDISYMLWQAFGNVKKFEKNCFRAEMR